MSAPLPNALRARFKKLVEEGLQRFDFTLNRNSLPIACAATGFALRMIQTKVETL